MKARPRSVERRVAEYLTEFSVSKGCSPIERIPILGRTGPDLTINELGLVIDVKSRLCVPKFIFPPEWYFVWFGELAAVRLKDLDALSKHNLSVKIEPSSVMVDRWFNHMDEWRKDKMPSGITVLVLHRPSMDIKSNAFVIRNDQRGEFYGKCNNGVRAG